MLVSRPLSPAAWQGGPVQALVLTPPVWLKAGVLAWQWLLRHVGQSVAALMVLVWLALPVLPAGAAPGLCVGPVCGDEFSRSAQYHWQLRLRVNDQRGHRERLVVDCRSGALSPQQGLVDRGYAGAVARRACRLAGESDG